MTLLPAYGGGSGGASNGLTNSELRAAPVDVEVTGDAPLPAGAATGAAQVIGNNSLASIDGKVLTEAQLRSSPVPIQMSAIAAATGSITANGQNVAMAVQNMGSAIMHCSGTFAGANCTFEGSLTSTNGTDGTWFGLDAKRTSSNTVEVTTGALSAAPSYGWRVNIAGLKYVRVRATAFTSGTQAWVLQPCSMAYEPAPAAQVSGTQPVSGSLTATSTPATPTALIHNSAATTNATLIKGSAGTLHGLVVSNTGAAVAYLKLHNLATAPTVGSTAVAVVVPIPAGGIINLNWGAMGMRFSAGISLSITNLAADSDTTAVAAGQVKATFSYI